MSSNKRKRSRRACGPCKERKRKCDGEEPCVTCTEWGYECSYETGTPRTKAPKGPSPTQRPALSDSNDSRTRQSPQRPRQDSETDKGALLGRIEANSSAAFVRQLALKIDPARAPRLNLFSWNIGCRQLSSPAASTSVPRLRDIASLDSYQTLAAFYFEKVHVTYAFIDKDAFFTRLHALWETPETSTNEFDSVVAGIAALGCLFSQRSMTNTEDELARLSCNILGTHRVKAAPSLDILTGWLLRLMYLRMTGSPHEAWIASSTLMHLLEAAGFYPEAQPEMQSIPSSLSQNSGTDIKRRLAGVAQHLNTWISYDLGFTRVSFQKDDVPPAAIPSPDNHTTQIIALLPIAIKLDPGRADESIDLVAILTELLKRKDQGSGFVMAQCNIVLCVLRRINAQNLLIPPSLIKPVLALFRSAMAWSLHHVADCAPWHQVANVPFQIICLLLVIGDRYSLELLPEALYTLQRIVSQYNTDTMREAYSVAGLLLALHQQQRKDDLLKVDEALRTYQQGAHLELPPQLIQGPEDFSWLEALVADMPGLQQVDLDQFLTSDVMGESGF